MTATLEERARELYIPYVFGQKLVARELGVSPSTVRRALHPERAERDRKLSRDAKRRRRGRCARCGAETRYNGHTDSGVSTYCTRCAGHIGGLANRAANGHVYHRLVAFLADGSKRFTEIRDELGLSSPHTSVHLNRRVRDGTVVRLERGLYALAQPTTAEVGKPSKEKAAS